MTRLFKELKKENYQLFKELEDHKRRLEDFTKSNGFSLKSSSSILNPLKEDLKSKITKLEKRVSELEIDNEQLKVVQKKSSVDNSSLGSANTQKENMRLRMKINELEHKLYQAV